MIEAHYFGEGTNRILFWSQVPLTWKDYFYYPIALVLCCLVFVIILKIIDE